MCYDVHTNQRYSYVQTHIQELRADAARYRPARQAHTPRRLRRYVGTLLIAAGESLVCRTCEPVRAHR